MKSGCKSWSQKCLSIPAGHLEVNFYLLQQHSSHKCYTSKRNSLLISVPLVRSCSPTGKEWVLSSHPPILLPRMVRVTGLESMKLERWVQGAQGIPRTPSTKPPGFSVWSQKILSSAQTLDEGWTEKKYFGSSSHMKTVKLCSGHPILT